MSDDFTADLKTAQDDLTRSREGMLQAVQALSDPDLDRVRRGGWPVRKVLEHVIHSERMYARLLAHMRGQTVEGEVPPSEPSTVADVVDKLGSSRQELMAALEGVDEESFYKFQTVGHEEYSILSALENVALHDREHSAQVQEILERT